MSGTNSHELFSLERIFSIKTLGSSDLGHKSSHSNSLDPLGFSSAFKSILPASARDLMDGSFGGSSPSGSHGSSDHSSVSIINVTHGGTIGNEFVAAYLSNNYLIFRYVGESGVPVIRLLPWSKDPAMRIMGMAFNHTAQWCMCVTTDVTVILIPIYFLMLRRGQESHTADSMIKIIKTASINSAEKKRKVTSCLWWRSANGQEYGVVASESGSLRFINLLSQECLRLKLRDPAIRMQIVSNSSKTLTYLLINGPQTSFNFKLLLEVKSVSGQWKNIITHHANPEFQPQPLNRFPRSAFKIRSQTSEKGPIITVFNRQTSEIQLFDASQDGLASSSSANSFPIFRYLLAFEPTLQVQLAHVAEHVLFVFSIDETKNLYKIQIVSRRLAETKAPANPTSPVNSPPTPMTSSSSVVADGFAILDQAANPEAILQEFYLRGTDVILGYLPPLPHPEIPDHLRRFDNSDSNEDSNSADEMVSVGEGGYFWTKDSIFQIKPDKRPEEIFYSLVAAGLEKTKAEPLGLTFGLNLLHLYELAADAYFAEGHDARALELYYLSEVSNTKLVAKFLEVGRINVIITRLRAALQRPRSLSIHEKKKLSNLLFLCFLHEFLHHRETSNTTAGVDQFDEHDEEFEKFLRYNEDYDSHQALISFQQYGLMHFFTIVAHARGLMPRALNLMLSERGHGVLSPKQLDYLRRNGFSEDIKNVAGGCLMSSLGGANEQLVAYLQDIGTVYRYFNEILALLPEVDANHLELVARYFDPLDCGQDLPQDDRLDGGKPISRPPIPFDCCEVQDYVDPSLRLRIFVTACLLLQRKAATHASPYPRLRGLQASRVAQVACGYNHTCARTESGQVFSWGSNSKGQLGQNNPDLDYCATPRRLDTFLDRPVDIISCGGNHCIAARTRDENVVFVWGDNSFGQLATGDREDRWAPCALSDAVFPPSRLGLTIKSIACGFYHTAVLTESGLFTAGQGICGQLGHSDTNDSLVFRFVNGLPKASLLTQVCCGYSHTIIRTEQGELWSFGTNLYGQLGLGHKNDPVPEPQAVAELGDTKRILQIACGSFTTSALTSLGNVLMWGRAGSSKSSISSDDPAFDVASPKLLEPLHGASCSLIASGPNHSIAFAEKGSIYVWGPGGRSMASSRLVPTESLSPGILAEFLPGSIKQLACGDECNMILTNTGLLYACGSGGFGKLGTGSTVDRKQPLMVYLDAVENHLESCAAVHNSAEADHFQPSLYSQDEILMTVLRAHVVQDPARSRLLLPICTKLDHLAAAACVYESLGHHSAGIEARIKLAERLFTSGNEASSQKQCEALIQGVGHLPLDQKGKEKLLLRLLQTWKKLAFPVQRLEEVVSPRQSILVLIGGIMRSAPQDQAGSHPIAGLEFCPEFYLRVVEATMKRLEEDSRNASSKNTASDASSTSHERLWTQIKANLEKDLDKRTRIVIPQVELRDHSKQRGAASLLPGDVAFSCGHLFTEKGFKDDIIPHFRERLAGLPVPLPLTSKLILADYQLNMMNLACPVCVFNYLRERHTVSGKPTIEKWVL